MKEQAILLNANEILKLLATIQTRFNAYNLIQYDAKIYREDRKILDSIIIKLNQGLDTIVQEEYDELTLYQKIEKFIKDNHYTYKVEDIIEEYKTKWGKAYVSYTMKHCIESLETIIQEYIEKGEE